MANKAISELPQALNVNNQDLFVLEQSGIAKKLTAETFITEQGIIDALAEALDGHGGIQSVMLSSVSGRIRTYRITFTDQSATTFQVYDGTSIDRISRTSSSGLDDVYTIFLSDGTTTFFTVHNGADGTVSEAMLNDALKGKAPAITETTESSAIANFPDGADDMVMHNVIAEINPVQDLTYGDPYPAGSGKNKFPTSSFSLGGTSERTINIYFDQPIPAGEYTFSYTKAGASTIYGIELFGENGRVAAFSSSNPVTRTLSEPAIRMYAYMDSTEYSDGKTLQITNIQLEAGSTATAYAPFSNICPISGWTGCNVTRTGKNELIYPYTRNSETVNGVTSTANSDGTVTVNGTCTASGGYFWLYGSSTTDLMSTLKEGETYTYSLEGAVSGLNGQVIFYGSPSVVYTVFGVNTAPSVTFTVPDMSGYNGFAVVLAFVNGTTYNNVTVKPMIRLASDSDTTYEPYIAPTTVSLSWQTEAGTVYGGTIDVATGLLTVDRAIITLDGTQNISASSNNRFYCNIAGAKTINASNQSTDTSVICDKAKPMSWAALSYDSYVGTSMCCAPVYGNGIAFRWDSVTTAADWKTYFTNNPTQFSYELATPQTYQLTPQEVLRTLLGTNNVWADTGNVSVTYPADTKMFIEKLTMPTEDDMVANQAITSGKYFMIGNSLYLALANIASGAQITIGTNAQRVSLADALNTINS